MWVGEEEGREGGHGYGVVWFEVGEESSQSMGTKTTFHSLVFHYFLSLKLNYSKILMNTTQLIFIYI